MDIDWLKSAILQRDYAMIREGEALSEAQVDDAKLKSEVISIAGLDPVEVFRALYSHAKQANPERCDDPYVPGELLYTDAQELFERQQKRLTPYFSLVRCRPLYCFLNHEELWAGRYNDFNGEGTAQRIVAAIRKIKGIPE
jgi:hypothetical protein